MNKILEFFFHCHTFDPTMWKSRGVVDLYEWDTDDHRCGFEEVFINTCLTCGTISERVISNQ